jgi:hypothetical protein
MTHTEDAYRTGRKAAELCQQVTPWLNAPVWAPTPLEPVHNWPDPSTASELIEWIRAARDTLAEVAQQAPKSYSPGPVGQHNEADLAQSRAAELAGHPGIPNTPAGVARVVAAEHSSDGGFRYPVNHESDRRPGIGLAAFSLYAAEANGMLM